MATYARQSVQHTAAKSKPLLTAIIAVAALTRFLFLARKSFWLDEGASVTLARLPWHDFLQRLVTHEANMAVYYFLLRAWLHVGHGEFWIRTLSVIAGIATVPIVYAIGRKLFDRRVGLAAALLLSVHVAHVAYSQEARGYSLAAFFASLSCLYFLRMIEAPGASDVVFYVTFTVLAVYTHFFAALIIAAQLLSLVALRYIPVRRLLISLASIVILCLPAALFATSKDVGQLAWIHRTDLKELHHAATLLTGNGPVLIVYLLLWLVALTGAVAVWRKFARSIESWRYAFILSWLFTPLVLILLISIKKPTLAPRFLLTSVPAAVLLAAISVFGLRRFPLRAASLVLAVLVSVGALAGYYRKPKENWRGVTQYVLTHAQPSDVVMIYPRWDAVAVDYYRSIYTNSPAPIFVEIPYDETFSVAHLAPRTHPRVWLIIYDWRLRDDLSAQRLRNLLDQPYTQDDVQRFGDIDIVRFNARP